MINGSLQGGSPAGPAPDILTGLQNVAKYLESTYATEAANHPGVRLVAHTVA